MVFSGFDSPFEKNPESVNGVCTWTSFTVQVITRILLLDNNVHAVFIFSLQCRSYSWPYDCV